ncbi:hypothetical protein ACGF4C_02620 [Streptomyces sp. NPDC048197]|uniref:hypothetical protein n=1 Tax=Streptomyces sp. NPDC048197 TaxID=3365511 RepID=UPI00371203C9
MVAPGFRSRIASSLLVAAVVLPVPVGAAPAAAADRQATPVDRAPQLVRPGDSPDDDVPEEFRPEMLGADAFVAEDFGSDLPQVEEPFVPGRGHSGHPGAPARFREFPDGFPGFPYDMAGYPRRGPHHHPGRWHGRWHHHPHPFGPGFHGAGAGSAEFAGHGHFRKAAPGDPSDSARAHPLPGRRDPVKRHAPTEAVSDAAPSHSTSSHRVRTADRRSHRSYETLPPLPSPTVPEDATTGTTDGDGDMARPYALESPTAPVERVLPMGAGLALTGLGLAFLGLRLRRR